MSKEQEYECTKFFQPSINCPSYLVGCHKCKDWQPKKPVEPVCPDCNGTGINPEKFPDARCPCTYTPADLQPEPIDELSRSLHNR